MGVGKCVTKENPKLDLDLEFVNRIHHVKHMNYVRHMKYMKHLYNVKHDWPCES